MTDEELIEALERVRQAIYHLPTLPLDYATPLAHPGGPKLGAYASDDPGAHMANRDGPATDSARNP